ncbi:MAG: sigma-70 family RNA polymerase sigma factor [Planctomycetes bacterium]|nr:sigma-70 family RNA polymerase sigma factor [Planctomycetota bacterium]
MTDPYLDYVRTPDRERFARFVAAYAGPVTRLARRLLGSWDLAEDVAQEVFARLGRPAVLPEKLRSPRTYVLRAAMHAALDRLRKEEVRSRHERESARRQAGFARSCDEDLAAKEWAWRIHEALDSLPQDFRLAMHLFAVEGLSYRQIAEVLSLKPATVATRIHRARRALRRLLGGALPLAALQGLKGAAGRSSWALAGLEARVGRRLAARALAAAGPTRLAFAATGGAVGLLLLLALPPAWDTWAGALRAGSGGGAAGPEGLQGRDHVGPEAPRRGLLGQERGAIDPERARPAVLDGEGRVAVRLGGDEARLVELPLAPDLAQARPREDAAPAAKPHRGLDAPPRERLPAQVDPGAERLALLEEDAVLRDPQRARLAAGGADAHRDGAVEGALPVERVLAAVGGARGVPGPRAAIDLAAVLDLPRHGPLEAVVIGALGVHARDEVAEEFHELAALVGADRRLLEPLGLDRDRLGVRQLHPLEAHVVEPGRPRSLPEADEEDRDARLAVAGHAEEDLLLEPVVGAEVALPRDAGRAAVVLDLEGAAHAHAALAGQLLRPHPASKAEHGARRQREVLPEGRVRGLPCRDPERPPPLATHRVIAGDLGLCAVDVERPAHLEGLLEASVEDDLGGRGGFGAARAGGEAQGEGRCEDPGKVLHGRPGFYAGRVTPGALRN